MEEIYYVGLYINDEYGTYNYLKFSNCPKINDFISFYETIKIENNKYKILDIIKKDISHNFEVNDILVGVTGMISLQVLRKNKIIYDGIETIYTINKKDFNGICENSIDYLIEQLYTKLQNYKTVKVNPYRDIEKYIAKYYNISQ